METEMKCFQNYAYLLLRLELDYNQSNLIYLNTDIKNGALRN